MNGYLIKHRFSILWLLLILLAYFLLRLPNLTMQPIFADEAIYIRWAQVMRAEPTLRFLPLSDGKTPLFMWLLIPLFKFFKDPLMAGRVLSVVSGFFTLLGIWFLGTKFFDKRVAIYASFFIVVTPYIVFFDRLALVDSMLAAFSIWSLNLAILLIKKMRIDLAMFLGYLFGGGILVKPPGFFSVLVLPATLFLFDWQKRSRPVRLLKLLGLWILTIIITLLIYNILRLGPGFSELSNRNNDYVFPVSRIWQSPLDPLRPHLGDLADWLPKLFGWPLFLLVFLGIAAAFFKKNKLAIAIFFWAIIPLVIQLMLLRTFTARYILFSIPPLLFLAAFGLDQIKFKLSWLLVLIMLVWPLYFDFYLLTNIEKAPLPKEERRGYLEDWTAGYGLKDIAQFLDEQSKSGTIVVGTEGSFGTLPDGLQIYLDKNRQVIIIGGPASISAQLKNAALDHKTFFVANKGRFSGSNSEDVQLLREYPKAKGDSIPWDSMVLFEVKPPKLATASAKLKT